MSKRVSIKLVLTTAIVVSAFANAPSSFGQQWAMPMIQTALTNPFGRDFQEMSDEDVKLMTASMRTVLERRVAGSQEAWTNDKSHLAGVSSLTRVYEQEGRPCGTVNHYFTKGTGKPYTLSFCKFEDGSWKIMP